MKQVQAHPMQKFIGKHVRMDKNVVLTIINVDTAVNYVTGRIEDVSYQLLKDFEIIDTLTANKIAKPSIKRKGNRITINQINIKYNL
jgi:hypothetical protein